MRIGRPLLKLPIRFCGETLAREVAALPPGAWLQHPQKYDGNIAVPLVSPGGTLGNGTAGPMGSTEWLQQCPYIAEVMAALDSTWGRSRLMGLEAGADVPKHVDIHYYWRTHLRIHIPVVTNPGVAFTSGDETVRMSAGECWILDSFYRHTVANRGDAMRIHLVLDTVGSGRLWDLIEQANGGSAESALIAPSEAPGNPLEFEQINTPRVMSPWEMRTHVAYIGEWTEPQPGRDEILTVLDRFIMAWSGTWARYAISDPGVPLYLRHLEDVRAALSDLDAEKVTMRNGRQMLDSVDRFILANAIDPAMIHKAPMAGVSATVRRSA